MLIGERLGRSEVVMCNGVGYSETHKLYLTTPGEGQLASRPPTTGQKCDGITHYLHLHLHLLTCHMRHGTRTRSGPGCAHWTHAHGSSHEFQLQLWDKRKWGSWPKLLKLD